MVTNDWGTFSSYISTSKLIPLTMLFFSEGGRVWFHEYHGHPVDSWISNFLQIYRQVMLLLSQISRRFEIIQEIWNYQGDWCSFISWMRDNLSLFEYLWDLQISRRFANMLVIMTPNIPKFPKYVNMWFVLHRPRISLRFTP